MRILFLTTSNLTTNPRLLKEIKVALAANFQVTVILFNLGKWTTPIEEKLRDELIDVKFLPIDISRGKLLPWIISTGINFGLTSIYLLLQQFLPLTAFASDKRSFLLYQRLKRLDTDSQLIIAHNLGALYPAFYYSQKIMVPFIFDVEDYHPGELIHRDAKNEKKRRETLLKSILPKAAYVTAASPLIAQKTSDFCNVNVELINNSFYSNEFTFTSDNKGRKVQFVWFSQNINYGRGLELIIPALDQFQNEIEISLIGNSNATFFEEWIGPRKYIKIISPLPQNELHKRLSGFDIGLALELTSADLNKDIALSNKIFAYKQAGLYILATDTKAQVGFMEHYKDGGYISEQNTVALAKGIKFIIDNINYIRAGKLKRFKEAKSLAFEHEAKSLLTLWETTLDRKYEAYSNSISAFSSL